jgi:hypothetical protein
VEGDVTPFGLVQLPAFDDGLEEADTDVFQGKGGSGGVVGPVLEVGGEVGDAGLWGVDLEGGEGRLGQKGERLGLGLGVKGVPEDIDQLGVVLGEGFGGP